MNALNQTGEQFRLSREDILGLRNKGYTRPEQLMLGTTDADKDRCEVFFKAKPAPILKANWLRDRSRTWKAHERMRAAERHCERAKGCREVSLINEFYLSRGDEFEAVFEKILAHPGVSFERLDDSSKTGAPDYLIKLKKLSSTHFLN